MELDNFLEVSLLLDYYEDLLSAKQKQYMKAHFEEDMGLSEIAKDYGVSRQAVYDNIKRGEKLLKSYEKSVGAFKREQEIVEMLKELKRDFSENKLEEIIKKIEA